MPVQATSDPQDIGAIGIASNDGLVLVDKEQQYSQFYYLV